MADENARTPGDRLYLIRLACGDGVRNAEILKAFKARIQKRTGRIYHTNALSLLERNEQGWRIEDARILAAVDPKGRGPIWLSALEHAAPVERPQEFPPTAGGLDFAAAAGEVPAKTAAKKPTRHVAGAGRRGKPRGGR